MKNETATFYARVSGDSMQGAGIDDGDLLVIDRSLQPQHDKIAVCFIDGEFTVKRLKYPDYLLLICLLKLERGQSIELKTWNS